MTGDDPKRRKAESIVKALRKSGTGDGLARDLARCSADEIYGYLLKRGYIWAKRHNEWMRQIELPWEAVMEKIQVEKIRIDGGTQSRAGMDMTTVDEYAEAMRGGANFPAVIVYFDGQDYWLADGFHRTHAAKKAELVEISAEVRQGTRRDAVLHSVSANARHGLKRTNADKRRAIETLLRDDEWRLWADRKIAEMVSVDHKTVGAVRADLVQRGEIPILDNIKVQRGDSEYTVTLNIYPPTPAAELDVEAARQIAVEVVVSEKTMIGTGYQSQLSDGTPYFFGPQTVEIDGEKLKVAKQQIGVQLSTVNGTGLYRFNANQLLEWIDERAALVDDRESVGKLYELTQREYSYLDAKIGKKLCKYGFAIEKNSMFRITGSGKDFIQHVIETVPVLRAEHEIRSANPKVAANLRMLEGENALVKVWMAQSAQQAWVREGEFYQSIQTWLPYWVERGYLVRVERVGVSTWNDSKKKVYFVAITPEGCALIGRDPLPMPEELSNWQWHIDGHIFIDPDGVFNAQVGDTVKMRNGDKGIVLAQRDYPTIVIKTERYGETRTLDPFVEVIERAEETLMVNAQKIWDIADAAGLDKKRVDFDVNHKVYLLFAGETLDQKNLINAYATVDADAIGRDVGVWISQQTPVRPTPAPAPGTTIAVGDANGKPLRIGSKVITRAGQKGEITAINGGLCRVQTAHMISQHRPATLTKVETSDESPADEKRHNDAQFMAAWYAMQSMNNQLEGVTGADKVFAQHLMSMMAMARDALADRLGIELREEVTA